MKTFYYGNQNADTVLIQLVGEHDLPLMEQEFACLQEIAQDFLLVAVLVDNWNEELSPWAAPAVFGDKDFGFGAEKTLAWLEKELLPELQETPQQMIRKEKTFYIGGYSLAGLFALWATCQIDIFQGVAAVSPSVWFPDFKEYIKEHPPKARDIYLSLGDKEEKTRSRVMAQVGSAIREIYAFLKEENVNCKLEWNTGNHFAEPEVRTAKGWAWLLDQ